MFVYANKMKFSPHPPAISCASSYFLPKRTCVLGTCKSFARKFICRSISAKQYSGINYFYLHNDESHFGCGISSLSIGLSPDHKLNRAFPGSLTAVWSINYHYVGGKIAIINRHVSMFIHASPAKVRGDKTKEIFSIVASCFATCANEYCFEL